MAEPNFLYLPRGAQEPGTLFLGSTKVTRHLAEAYRVAVPPGLCQEIRASVKMNPRDWLFCKTDGVPYSSKVFSGWTRGMLKKIFPECPGSPTVTMLRHSYLCNAGIENMTPDERRNLAKKMLHSEATQQDYLFRNVQDINLSVSLDNPDIEANKINVTLTDNCAKSKIQVGRKRNVITI